LGTKGLKPSRGATPLRPAAGQLAYGNASLWRYFHSPNLGGVQYRVPCQRWDCPAAPTRRLTDSGPDRLAFGAAARRSIQLRSRRRTRTARRLS